MNAPLPRPITLDDHTVTLSRADWEAHIAMLEDLSDQAAVARIDAMDPAVVRRDSVTGDEMARMLDGISAVTIHRERAGMTRKTLAASAGISPSYLTEIEKGRKPGSIAAIRKLAHALGVSMDALTA